MTHDYLLEVNELRGEFCSTNIIFLIIYFMRPMDILLSLM